jgi:TolB protein
VIDHLRRKRRITAGIALSTLFAGIVALVPTLLANVRIVISDPSRQPFPLAIPEFKNLGKGTEPQNLSKQFADQLVSDLRLTGLFNLLDRKGYLEDPTRAGLLPEQFDFGAWKQIDALGLVKGGYETAGSSVSVQLRIFDVVASAQIGGKLYNGSVKDTRRLAHQMANEVVYQFTGERGFFNSKIAAVSNQSGHKEIMVMDVDGQAMTQLSNNRSINILPAWSARGDQLAYTSYKAGNPDLYVADLVRGVTRRISSFQGINSGAAFAPDGSAIALTLSKDGDPDLYLIDDGGKELTRLTRSYGVDSSPTWSPDGKRLAFVSSRAGGAHIYVVNRDGSGTKRLTFAGNQNVSPAWSPKGDKIAFSGRDQGAFDIFVMNADGSKIVRITQDQGDNEDPSWSPDGNYIVFSSTRDKKGASQLYIASADGRSQVRITSGPGSFSNPEWSPFVDW